MKYILNLTFGLAFVVLSASEGFGAKSLVQSSPEDPESSVGSTGISNKPGHDIRLSHGGTGKRYSAAAAAPSSSSSFLNSISQLPPSSYSNLNSGYFNGGYNFYPSSASYRHASSYLYDPYERTARDYRDYQPAPVPSASYIEPVVHDYVASASNDKKHGGGHGGLDDSTTLTRRQSDRYGWGWGHMKHQQQQQQDNSAIQTGLGLLGLLGLLSMLQSVLAAIATTTAASTTTGRRKRNTAETKSIQDLILPYLNVVAHARQGTIPMACTQRQICFVNKILRQQLGPNGHFIGKTMSHAMKELLLQNSDINASELPFKRNVIQSIDTASRDGLANLDCHNLYPICNEMKAENGTVVHPPSLLLQSHVSG